MHAFKRNHADARFIIAAWVSGRDGLSRLSKHRVGQKDAISVENYDNRTHIRSWVGAGRQSLVGP